MSNGVTKKRIKARAWMVENGLRPVDIQNHFGHKSISQTTDTLAGERHDRRVLGYLKELGCPIEYLNLPEDMSEEA